MLIFLYLFCFKLAYSRLIEPKFQIFTPNELAIEIPQTLKEELVVCKLGVKKNPSVFLDFDCDATKNKIFINDKRLNLEKEDVIKYVMVFKNSEDYSVKSGSYIFDGSEYNYCIIFNFKLLSTL